MSYDYSWSMPTTNWQPSASFLESATPPLGGPIDGDLVQLPCINVDWLPLLLGAIDQLRNPSTWLDTLSDAALDTVLGRVDYLRSLVAQAVNVPCCSYQVQLAANCELQFSTDGGSTWHPVPGWDANFGPCVKAAIPPVPPPNPEHTPIDQNACNLAGFIAAEVLQQSLVVAHNALTAGNTVLQFFQSLAADIATGNPFLEVLVTVANDMYPTVQAEPIGQVAAASTDPVLRDSLTCAIFNALRGVGYVDSSNFAAIQAAIGAISYTYSWVPPMLSNAWRDMGVQFIQMAEPPGGIDVIDCSGCGPWCFELDFNVAANGGGLLNWVQPPGFSSVWVSGMGWVGVPYADPVDGTKLLLGLQCSLPSTIPLTGMTLVLGSSAGRSGPATYGCSVEFYIGTSPVNTLPLTCGPNPFYTTLGNPSFSSPISCNLIDFSLEVDNVTPAPVLRSIKLHGTGVCPFGTPNC